MLRVVIDTNILVAAFHRPSGRYASMWRAALARQYVLVWSPPLASELASVLRNQLQWEEHDVQRRIRDVAAIAEMVQPGVALRVAADPDDDRVLECAVDGNADLIVSNDKHLRSLRSFRGVTILHGSDFLRILGL